MACILVRLPVTLTIAGPILTSGETHSQWGLDAAFYRDWQGRYALPGSHIRGKLREAMEAIASVNASVSFPIEDWFGKESGNTEKPDGPWEPRRGGIKVYDFIYKEGLDAKINTDNVRHRIRLERERGVVETGALMMDEAPFVSGAEYAWRGAVEFFTTPEQKAAQLEQIKQTFLFIPSIGALKSIGCGRLKQVVFDEPLITDTPKSQAKKFNSQALAISITPLEPLFIGGVRRAENVFVSSETIPGNVIKGALAVGLNRLASNKLNTAIGPENHPVNEHFPLIAAHFSDLIFLQAIPAAHPNERAQTIPLSGVAYGNDFKDIAFETADEKIFASETTPVSFQIDWKKRPNNNFPPNYKRPQPAYHTVIRTAIDDNTHRAKEGQLYSLRMLKPDPLLPLCWNTEIRFPKAISAEERAALGDEIQKALPLGLRYLGKRQSRVKIGIRPSHSGDALKTLQSSRFAIVLQTPALMLNPVDLVNNDEKFFDDKDQIQKMYQKYWRKRFGAPIKMTAYYAAQELMGGYVGMRFMRNHYQPFYLTSAGSTFVFDRGQAGVPACVKEWRYSGLPLPQWALDVYGNDAWRSCPYIPQNGYGEIVVNTPSDI